MVKVTGWQVSFNLPLGLSVEEQWEFVKAQAKEFWTKHGIEDTAAVGFNVDVEIEGKQYSEKFIMREVFTRQIIGGLSAC